MKDDITICIGTVGYPTFSRCYKIASRIKNNDSRVKDLVVIKNKFPTSNWLNEMRTYTSTSWVLQVDEDMYLHDNCIDELLLLAESASKKNVKVLNASGLLYDLFLNTSIGSIKLWNTDAFKVTKFKNIKGSDRQFAKDASKFGFRNVEVHKVLGKHDSAPSIEIAYFKYKEYIEKIRKFDNDVAAKNFFRHISKLGSKRKDLIGKFAVEGARAGLAGPIDQKTKDYRKYELSPEILRLKKKYGII